MKEAENIVVSVSRGADVRMLRTALMELSYKLAEQSPETKGLLVLVASKITPERLRKEWQSAQRVLRPDVMNRLSVVLHHHGHLSGLPADPDAAILQRIESLTRESRAPGTPIRRIDPNHEILKILVHRWLLGLGPISMLHLGRIAGYSFPTVAAAVRRLANSVARSTARGVELAGFPYDAWARMVAVAESARSTVRFTDRSGQRRSPESLLRRFRNLPATDAAVVADIAVGGAFGARHHFADLDLVGTPRLDLTIHAPAERMDLSFIKQLDPALEITTDPSEFSNVTTHVIRRRESFFDTGADGVRWADPVECLLDLHEMKLEPQAREFLDALIARRPASRG